jgi:FkbM family methyltransferase
MVAENNVLPKKKTVAEAMLELNMQVEEIDNNIHIINSDKVVIIDNKQHVYIKTIMYGFDYYFDSVDYKIIDGKKVVDFSKPAQHKVKGFDLFEPFCPSIAEPFVTIEQYLNFASLNTGDVVFDLGAYSGLTSIAFAHKVGESGRVIALEPDFTNYQCLEKNISLSKTDNIEILNAAVWTHTGSLEFSLETSMGSSAVDLVGARGEVVEVQCCTLYDLAKKYNLDKVDFIKCDIEGAESYIFENKEFFDHYKPKIIVEAHNVHGVLNIDTFTQILQSYGYKSEIIDQTGITLPLVQFTL